MSEMTQETVTMMQYRTLPLYLSGATVERETHTIAGVSLAQAVEARGHGVALDDVTLEQIAALGNLAKKGVKSRFTHPGLSEDGLGKYLGRFRKLRREGDKVLGDLHLSPLAFQSPAGNLGEYVLLRAETEPETFGFSVVVYGATVWRLPDGREIPADGPRPDDALNELPALRVEQLTACDAVDEPAANRDGVFGALWGTNVDAAHWFGEVDAMLQQAGVTPEKAHAFALRYFAARGVDVHQEGEQNVEKQTKQEQEQVANGTVVEDSRSAPAATVAPAVTAATAVAENPVAQELEVARRMNEDMAALRAELNAQAVTGRIEQAGLTEASRRAVRVALAGRMGSVALSEVDELIQAQRDVEAAAAARPSIKGAGPITAGQMTTGEDQAQGAFDWLFGVRGVPMPAPTMRNIRDLYLELTADYGWTGRVQTDGQFWSFATASTTSLPALAANAFNKAIRQHYASMTTYRWYEHVVNVEPHDGSTHDMQWIMVGGIGDLPTVAEGAPYSELAMVDSQESSSFLKKGGYVGLTLEMIRRSDIQRIQAIPRELTKAALRTRSAAVAGMLTAVSYSGVLLAQDGQRLFSAAHNNFSNTVFSATTWAEARAECWKQAIPGTGGKPLGL